MRILSATAFVLATSFLGSASFSQETFNTQTRSGDITISGTNISELPEFIVRISGIRSLSIDGTAISDLSSRLPLVSSPIESLNVSSNDNLASLPSLANFSTVHTVIISDNPLVTDLSTTIAGLSNVVSMNLSENNISQFTFGEHKHLRELDVSDNPIADSNSLDLGGLTSLEVLVIECLDLTEVPADIVYLTNLISVRMGGNNIPTWQTDLLKDVLNRRVAITTELSPGQSCTN